MSHLLLCLSLAGCGLSTLVLALGDPPSPPQDSGGAEAQARAILEELERGIGTPADRAKVRAITMKGKLVMPGMKVEGSFEEVYGERPRALLSMHWPGYPAAATSGCAVDEHGTWTWTTDPAFGVYIAEGAQGGGFLRQLGIARRDRWDTLYESARLVGSATVAERECDELELQPKGSGPKPPPVERWFVRRDTHELARVDLVFPDPTGGALPISFLLGDWRRVDGVSYHFSRTMRVGQMEIGYRYESVVHESELAPERLAPSEKVLAARNDPKQRAAGVGEDPEACSVVELAEQPCATVRKEIAATDVAKELAVMLPEVGRHVTSAGVDPVGPPFSRYHSIGDGKIDLEAGMPIKKAVPGEGRVRCTSLPGGKAAMTWHVGPYHELQRSHERLREWIEANQLEPDGGFWEIYWTDPGIEPDPTKWKTQIYWPLK